MPRWVRIIVLSACILCAISILVTGCATQARIVASPALEAKIALLQDEVHAGRDTNSTLVFAIAIGGLALCALAYPVGKVVWLVSAAAKRRVLPKAPPECDPNEV